MTIKKRMTLLFIVDSMIVFFSLYVGHLLLNPGANVFASKTLLFSVITIQIAHHFFAWRYGLYRRAWSYASIGELKAIFKAVTFTILIVAAVQFIVVQNVFVRALILIWMFHM